MLLAGCNTPPAYSGQRAARRARRHGRVDPDADRAERPATPSAPSAARWSAAAWAARSAGARARPWPPSSAPSAAASSATSSQARTRRWSGISASVTTTAHMPRSSRRRRPDLRIGDRVRVTSTGHRTSSLARRRTQAFPTRHRRSASKRGEQHMKTSCKQLAAPRVIAAPRSASRRAALAQTEQQKLVNEADDDAVEFHARSRHEVAAAEHRPRQGRA